MNSQEFLFLNIGIAAAFALWYWSSRKPKAPTLLNLKAKDSQPTLLPAIDPHQQIKSNQAILKADMRKHKDYSQIRLNNLPPQGGAGHEGRQLNVVFNYNGHSWDAYEVFGLPAGAPLRDVTAAYQKALKEADKESHEFMACAYKAILDRVTL